MDEMLLALTNRPLLAALRWAMSMTAAQSVAVGTGVVVPIVRSGWAGHLRTRPERSPGRKRLLTFGQALLGTTAVVVSVLASGAADREPLTAAFNIVHRKVRFGFRERGGSQELLNDRA